MSRYSPFNIEPVLNAAEAWRDRCLLNDGSILSDGNIWTEINLRKLFEYYSQNPDSSDRNFFDKLKDQISSTPPDVKKLAAEMLWFMFLFVFKTIGKEKKVSNIESVWNWSGHALDTSQYFMNASLETGVGKTGAGFNTRRWNELNFFIDVVLSFKLLSEIERQKILKDPWVFSRWLDAFEKHGRPQLAHILKFLLFPDYFESISTVSHKLKIVNKFHNKTLGRKDSDLTELDKELYDVRKEQEEKYSTNELSFYRSPLKEIWQDEGISSVNRKYWIEKSIVKDRPDRAGKDGLGEALWSPKKAKDGKDIYSAMREVNPDDIVFHFTDNEGIIGASRVARKADDFTGIPGTEWEGMPAYRVQLSDYIELEPKLHRSDFLNIHQYEDRLQRILNDNRGLFYNKKLELNQGAYLTKAPLDLVLLMDDVYFKNNSKHLPYMTSDIVNKKPVQNDGENVVSHNQTMPLNVIYYGPPGTGKTYITIQKAVEICDGTASRNRNEVVRRFEELQNEKRISFVTFHQSYSYEDFVEGIRPNLTDDGSEEPTQRNAEITYECRPGIFKTICSLAKTETVKSQNYYDFDDNKNNVWKMSLGNTLDPNEAGIYEDCIENGYIALGYGLHLDYTNCNDRKSIESKLREVKPELSANDYNITSVNYFKNKIVKDDLVVITDGNLKYRAIGRVTGDYYFQEEAEDMVQRRPVEWLITYGESQPYEKILNKKFSQMTLYYLTSKVLKLDVLKKILGNPVSAKPENHVLIIDEINRGNIAKIFGELITLIEPDKRLGAINQLSVTLPYSGDSFGVPENLYLICTMNTADRSIALLDTALRRRFEFKELIPDSSLIDGVDGRGGIQDDNSINIDLRALLDAINVRIRFMLNRNQTIGHAYFMNIKNFSDLKVVLSQQIIPLLQEYFYEDWHRIQLIFRDIKEGNEKNKPQLIQSITMNELDVLGYDHDEYDDETEYLVTPENEITTEMIRKIYL